MGEGQKGCARSPWTSLGAECRKPSSRRNSVTSREAWLRRPRNILRPLDLEDAVLHVTRISDKAGD